MQDRRNHDRFFCADLVEVVWFEGKACHHKVANLEDISASGICLLLDCALPIDVELLVRCSGKDLRGWVRHCAEMDSGHLAGVEFHPESRWSAESFRPRHLLNPHDIYSDATL